SKKMSKETSKKTSKKKKRAPVTKKRTPARKAKSDVISALSAPPRGDRVKHLADDREAALETVDPRQPFVRRRRREYRIAACLDVLRSQVNALAPQRRKDSDGWIGDAD